MTDNQEFRALFSLPPIPVSASTALATVQTPTPKNETGDRELDAVLWLRDCIKTAHPALIENALEAFKKIKTSAKDLERRYSDYLVRASGGNTLAAVFGGFDFASLEGFAQASFKKKARQDEALVFNALTSAIPLPEHISRQYFRLALLGALNWSLTWFKPGKDSPARVAQQILAIFRTPL